jgi:hypothetical protein
MCRNCLIIDDGMQEGSEWVEGMGEEDVLAIHYDEDDHKDGEGNIADTLTVLLFKLWRHHVRSLSSCLFLSSSN